MAIGIGMMTVLILFGSVFLFLFVRQMRLWRIMSNFPGPKAYPLVGSAYLFDRDPREFFKMMQRWAVDFAFNNPDKKTMAVWVGPVPVIATGSAQDIETILTSNKQLNKGLFYQMLTPWLGSGLLLSKGKKWQTRRKLLTPSFHFSVLASFIDIFNEQAQILTRKLSDVVGQKSVNIFPYVTCCTLDIICATAMGIKIGAQEGKNKEYVQAIIEMCDIIQDRQKYPWLWIDFIYNLLPKGKKHNRYVKILHNMTRSVIEERLKEKRQMNGTKDSDKVIENGSVHKRKRMAFLDLLLDLHEEDGKFTIDDVREEVDTFMFEGHDTTAAAVSWVLFMLGLHPKVQAKVHKELDEVFGDDRERNVTNDDIQKLQYLSCVIKETLRCFPSVPLIGRQLEESLTLSGHSVPKGTLVVIGLFMVHRDPDHYPDPDIFNPDNFLPENVEKRHPFAFIPFSAGQRNCIGQKFALMEEKVILATLLRKLKFRSLQSIDTVTPTGEIILRPHNGIKMEITLRE